MTSILSARIKEERLRKGLNQPELAKVLNVTKQTISNWENGNRIPDTTTLAKLSELFECTSDYLLGKTDTREILPSFAFEKDSSTSKMIDDTLSQKEKLNIEKEAQKMVDNIDKMETVEFFGQTADEEDKEYLKLAYEKFLTDVRIYNKQKYTPKKYKK